MLELKNLLELKSKKGFSLIEVICSIAIFLIFSCLIFNTRTLWSKVHSLSTEYNIATLFIDGLRNEMIYNSSYKDIEKLLGEQRFYVNKENIQLKELYAKGLDVFQKEKPKDNIYITAEIQNGDVLNIKLNLSSETLKNKVIECEFIKGKYK